MDTKSTEHTEEMDGAKYKVTSYVTKKEYERLESKAKKDRRTISAYVRGMIASLED